MLRILRTALVLLSAKLYNPSMAIRKLRVSDFRNFKDKLFEFSPETTIIVGPNASGKTNILESIYLLSAGKSFHAKLNAEMINYASDLTRVKGLFGNDLKLEVVLTRGEVAIDSESEKKRATPKKRFLINGVGKMLYNFAGNFKAVLFGPWDLDLVTDSPSIRRRFLDSVLSQIDREYRRSLLSYEKGLRQRNKLLIQIREEGLSRSQLLFWDKLLIKNGEYISKNRGEFLDFANSTSPLDGQSFRVDYDRSVISEARIGKYAKKEVAAGTTLVGPHRDDIKFSIINSRSSKKGSKPRDLSTFGSRGEQRMGVLWLKLAELEYIEKNSEEKPTLLLDDIFSELDHKHRDVVMDMVRKGDNQVILTTADPHFVEGFEGVRVVRL